MKTGSDNFNYMEFISLLVTVYAVIFMRFCLKRKKPVRTAAAAMLCGSISLLLSYGIGLHFGLYTLTVNFFTTAASLLGGVPFVIFYTIFCLT